MLAVTSSMVLPLGIQLLFSFRHRKTPRTKTKENTSFIPFFLCHRTPTFTSAALFFHFFHFFECDHKWFRRQKSHLEIDVLHVYIHVTFHGATKPWRFHITSLQADNKARKKRPICSHFAPSWYYGAVMVERRNGTGGRWSSSPYPGGADDPRVNLICSSPADKHCRS